MSIKLGFLDLFCLIGRSILPVFFVLADLFSVSEPFAASFSPEIAENALKWGFFCLVFSAFSSVLMMFHVEHHDFLVLNRFLLYIRKR